jgi:hypothetical protein
VAERTKTDNGKGNCRFPRQAQDRLLHCGGKSAAFGRDDEFGLGVRENEQQQGNCNSKNKGKYWDSELRSE